MTNTRAMQQDKYVNKISDKQAGRIKLIALVIILFFLFLAWATWCFFDWKIKTVERSTSTVQQSTVSVMSHYLL